MKSLRVKLLCIFIIAMFCLTPLGAVDLNQDDNNNKYINQDDDMSIDTEDANIASEDDDSGIKVESDADSDDEKELDEAGKNKLAAVDGNDKENISKVIDNESGNLKDFPAISVHADDVFIGEPAVIKLDADESVNMRVRLFLRNSGWTQFKYTYIKNGYGELVLNDLPGTGTYKVVVYDENMVSSLASTNFNVKKPNPNLSINVENIDIGQKATVYVGADASIKEVTVKLNSSDNEYPISLTDGTGSLTIDEDLAAGEYLATVSYAGDNTFGADSKSTTFRVNGLNPEINVTVDDIEVGERPTVNIQTPFESERLVEIQLYKDSTLINATPIYVTYSETMEMFDSISEPGEYTVKVVFDGDGKYEACESTASFMVNEKPPVLVDPGLSISVADIDVDDKAVAVVSANETLNGEARVYLNGSNAVYPVSIVDGSGSVTIDDDLAAGEYLATVRFLGDDTFLASDNSTTFKVNEKVVPELVDPGLSISVADIDVGDKAVAVISANETLNGEARVYLNGSNAVYPVSIVDGSGSVTIDEDLAPGDYLATVRFVGDDTFMASDNSTTFKVNEKAVPELVDPNLSIKVDNITEGEKAVAVISANETLNGEARVYLNGSNAVYPVSIVDGSGSVTIDDDLAAGEYLATVRFLGDDTFKLAENSTAFKVNNKSDEKADPKLNIMVDNTTYGHKAVVSISTDEKFSGYVSVDVGWRHYNVKVVNGKARLSVYCLPAGKYTVKANIKETKAFKASTKYTKFVVEKANVKLTSKVKANKKAIATYMIINWIKDSIIKSC